MTGRAWMGAMGAFGLLLQTACPRPPMPKGPPPEYEEPADPLADAGVSAPAPPPPPPPPPSPAVEPPSEEPAGGAGDAGPAPEGATDPAPP